MRLVGAGTCTINGSCKGHCWPTYLLKSNELWLSWRVTVWEGITWALTEYILTEDLAWSWLWITQWADRMSVFPAGWTTIVPPPNVLHSKSLHNTWHLGKFLAIFDGFLYFSSAHFCEFSELPCQSPQLGNTGKYTPCRAGPIRKNPVFC